MGAPALVASRVSLILDLPPSCLQFCPAHPEYFVIGTYNLQKEDGHNEAGNEQNGGGSGGDVVTEVLKLQNRDGSLIVFQTDGSTLNQIQTVSHPSALLDLRFHPHKKHGDVFAAISSTGVLAFFSLNPMEDPSNPLMQLTSSRCQDLDEDVLFLQCNWHPSDDRLLGVTTSTGLVRLLRLDEAWNIVGSEDIDIENSLEAWSIAFAPDHNSSNEPGSTTVYAGGDDSILRYNSYLLSKEEDSIKTDELSLDPVSIRGQHNAGVTAIMPLSLRDPRGCRLVVTGSYDDHIRLFSIQDPAETYGMKQIRLLAEENLGGGVWRLDLVDINTSEMSTKIRILASCMYAGARIVCLENHPGDDWKCEVLARFEEHKSMNYASGIVPSVKRNGGLNIVSSSFYDKLLCLWEYNI